MATSADGSSRLPEAQICEINGVSQQYRQTLVLGRGVAAARDAGVPIAEVARLAGISRQAVYDILRKRSSQK